MKWKTAGWLVGVIAFVLLAVGAGFFYHHDSQAAKVTEPSDESGLNAKQKKITALFSFTQVPKSLTQVSTTNYPRNGKEVQIERYQKQGPVKLGGPYVDLMYNLPNHDLEGYIDLSEAPSGPLPTDEQAQIMATQLWKKYFPEYYKTISFVTIEEPTRSFIDADGHKVTVPLKWVKFQQQDGAYAWISFTKGSRVVEMERDSHWAFGSGRRATPQWQYDDWLNGYQTHGAELPAPNALYPDH